MSQNSFTIAHIRKAVETRSDPSNTDPLATAPTEANN